MLTDSIVPSTRRIERRPSTALLDRLCRGPVHSALRRMSKGAITLQEHGGSHVFGDESAAANDRALLAVHDARFYRAAALGGSLGAGEAYIDGFWSSDNLTRVVQLLIRNEAAFERINGPTAWLSSLVQRAAHAWRRNSRSGSRRNIAAHYDLSNEFYALFLDETMTYSSGIFPRADATLTEASVAKLDRICRKLNLRETDHVLEIGTGWGSFALHAAARYGCRVTTTTISRQQHALASQRVAEAGLSDRVTLLVDDYRDLSGTYDKLVSIEMIEAVGWQYYDTYFRKCAALLKPDGVACIQAITLADRYYEKAKREVDYIKRYVFPGSCIPALGAMSASVARATDMTIIHVEEIGPHYARTLRAWRERFMARLPEVRALGFSDAFIRLWEFYLSYCEAAYLERSVGDVQMLLAKPEFRGEPPLGALGH